MLTETFWTKNCFGWLHCQQRIRMMTMEQLIKTGESAVKYLCRLKATENQPGPTTCRVWMLERFGQVGLFCLQSGGNPLLSAAVWSSLGFSINVWRGALTRQLIPFLFVFFFTAFAGRRAVLCHHQGVGSSLSLLEWGGLAGKTLLRHPTGKVVSTGTSESVTSRPHPFTLLGATTVLQSRPLRPYKAFPSAGIAVQWAFLLFLTLAKQTVWTDSTVNEPPLFANLGWPSVMTDFDRSSFMSENSGSRIIQLDACFLFVFLIWLPMLGIRDLNLFCAFWVPNSCSSILRNLAAEYRLLQSDWEDCRTLEL